MPNCEHEVKIVRKEIMPCNAPGAWYGITYENSSIRSRVILCDKHKKKMEDQGYTVTRE
jgi:hypothetical protein